METPDAINVDDYLPQPTRLKADFFEEVGAAEYTVTIDSVEARKYEAFEGRPEERRIAVHFAELSLPLELNRTNLRFMVDTFGKDTREWKGKRLRLVRAIKFNPQTKRDGPSIALDRELSRPAGAGRPGVVRQSAPPPVEITDDDLGDVADPFAQE